MAATMSSKPASGELQKVVRRLKDRGSSTLGDLAGAAACAEISRQIRHFKQRMSNSEGWGIHGASTFSL